MVSNALRLTVLLRSLLLTALLLCNKSQSFAPSIDLRNPRSLTQLSGLFGNLFGKDDVDPNAPKRLFEIPVSDIKVGGLRLTLAFLLMGQQNSPAPGSWKANQAEDGVLDMYYQDQTGMFSISFSESSVKFDRYGPSPSLQYCLQESLVLHNILDELNMLAFGNEDEVEEDNRLIKLMGGDEIEKARETLPARKVQ
mmetsp:Transcript_35534/g.43504  ORF Transcript_35534/g.43504 Transcript_35534/m.43504 type:complete len:196 (-) Transcript_35534:181-768(-)|eukprot:CAMPEP_0172512468 /NCGR_PEP_ID=MMETSP1066-20121228/244922_1 /TAXON_ID=671091 /ORGANISM="Coscinodiscus wailesii, Strain CCMP2513" /LENGTH=195 /DNA_ID=CAMNT_0013292305 /DNA_START=98 /DNA_END=685 /DNA_ORIENTATION=+